MSPIKVAAPFIYKLFFVLLISFYFCSVASASEINLSRSKLIQLALHLEAAEQEKQYDFSRIALLEMYNTYLFELERSYTHLPKTAKRRAKVRGWRFATQSYLETINNYLFLMDSGMPLGFFVSKQNKIFLLIGELPVIISGPNSGADKQIETNIVEQFCLQYDCREYFEQTHLSTKTLSFSNKLNGTSDNSVNTNSLHHNNLNYENIGEWSLASMKQSSFIMDNGLVFNFSTLKDRSRKQLWAMEISNELFTLMEQLQRAKEKNNVINWSVLHIEELPLTDNAYKIVINQRNDYIKVSLPLLGGNPELFKILIPWLKSHFEKTADYRMIINNTDQYLMTK